MVEIKALKFCPICHGTGIEYLNGDEFPCSQCIRTAYLAGEISPEEYRDELIIVRPCDDVDSL